MRKLGLMIVSLAFLAGTGFAEEVKPGSPALAKEQPAATASNDTKAADPSAAVPAKKKEEKKDTKKK